MTRRVVGRAAATAPPEPEVHARLRVRLLTLALFDDVVALVIIAGVYTTGLSALPLALSFALLGALAAVGRLPSAWRGRAAAVVGVGLWVALHAAHVDPVVAGLAVGLATSAFPPRRAGLEQVVRLTRSFREQPTPELARTARRGVATAISPNERLQHALHPWTSFVIVPLFALANAGLRVDGDLLHRAVGSPITVGILLGYIVGKPLGVAGAATLALRLRLGQRALSSPAIVGVGIVAGIGFTVALLISSLAFSGPRLDEAKLGVLAGAAVTSSSAWGAFRLLGRVPASTHRRRLASTIDELVDLADDVDPRRDHVRGAPEAPVTLVEYGDYECPYCGQAEVVVRELLQDFGDDLRYVWRHLPLSDVHPHAQLAAEAAEAAAARGAFWAMHDKLMAHQDALSAADLRRYAQELGLDAGAFRDELDRRVHAERVAEDVASADAGGVAGTPSFFVNGKRHDGAYDLAALSAAVRAARERAASIG